MLVVRREGTGKGFEQQNQAVDYINELIQASTLVLWIPNCKFSPRRVNSQAAFYTLQPKKELDLAELAQPN